ncbi:DUF4245 family protein [Labedella endophytica]|uniref:DUF4245 domain-containing protein n=1 Tax=Labedella endophytica TaxID=1523160 RepID=A0A3S0V9H3_9MICO|nr:DUF4245 family protein [Labedella endophytica]RUQ99202.1 DUF4245 domain-containing protein [Labedella endophytica]
MSQDPRGARRPPRGRVVAELGRPETPEETAARKAENSRNYRARKTINNLVYSLLATVGVVVLIVLVVPRSDQPLDRAVDWRAVTQEAQQTREETLVDPELPAGWTSNYAEIRSTGTGGVTSWNLGFVTPSDDAANSEFVGVTQGFDADPTWLAVQLNRSAASSVVTIGGLEWTVYDNREDTDGVGNVHYALATEAGSSTVAVFGTATMEDITLVAEAIAPQVADNAAAAPADDTAPDGTTTEDGGE